jgi:hypothetical protein
MVDRFRAITHVLRQEASINLGLAGKKLRLAMDALRQFDTHGARGHSPRRQELVHNAAHALSAYVIQTEALGLRNDEAINAEFGITKEIWNCVGAVTNSAPNKPRPM